MGCGSSKPAAPPAAAAAAGGASASASAAPPPKAAASPAKPAADENPAVKPADNAPAAAAADDAPAAAADDAPAAAAADDAPAAAAADDDAPAAAAADDAPAAAAVDAPPAAAPANKFSEAIAACAPLSAGADALCEIDASCMLVVESSKLKEAWLAPEGEGYAALLDSVVAHVAAFAGEVLMLHSGTVFAAFTAAGVAHAAQCGLQVAADESLGARAAIGYGQICVYRLAFGDGSELFASGNATDDATAALGAGKPGVTVSQGYWAVAQDTVSMTALQKRVNVGLFEVTGVTGAPEVAKTPCDTVLGSLVGATQKSLGENLVGKNVPVQTVVQINFRTLFRRTSGLADAQKLMGVLQDMIDDKKGARLALTRDGGASVLVLFGGPGSAIEDEEEAASAAMAFAMVINKAAKGKQVWNRVGVSTGPVAFVRGPGGRVVATGPSLVAASGLAWSTAGTGVLVDEETKNRASSVLPFEVKKVGAVRVAALKKSIPAFVPSGIKRSLSLLLSSKPQNLFGRDEEYERTVEALKAHVAQWTVSDDDGSDGGLVYDDEEDERGGGGGLFGGFGYDDEEEEEDVVGEIETPDVPEPPLETPRTATATTPALPLSFIMMRGKPGMGKRAFLAHILAQATTQSEMLVVLVGSGTHRKDSMFGSFQPIIEMLLGLESYASTYERREIVRCFYEDIAGSRFRRSAPLVAQVLGIPMESNEFVDSLHPTEQRPKAVLDAIVELFRSSPLLSFRPWMICIEEASGMDTPSIDLIKQLVLKNKSDKKLCVMMTSSAEANSPALDSLVELAGDDPANALEIKLEPLSEDGVSELVKEKIGKPPCEKTLVWVIEETGGMPLRITELMELVAQQKGLIEPDNDDGTLTVVREKLLEQAKTMDLADWRIHDVEPILGETLATAAMVGFEFDRNLVVDAALACGATDGEALRVALAKAIELGVVELRAGDIQESTAMRFTASRYVPKCLELAPSAEWKRARYLALMNCLASSERLNTVAAARYGAMALEIAKGDDDVVIGRVVKMFQRAYLDLLSMAHTDELAGLMTKERELIALIADEKTRELAQFSLECRHGVQAAAMFGFSSPDSMAFFDVAQGIATRWSEAEELDEYFSLEYVLRYHMCVAGRYGDSCFHASVFKHNAERTGDTTRLVAAGCASLQCAFFQGPIESFQANSDRVLEHYKPHDARHRQLWHQIGQDPLYFSEAFRLYGLVISGRHEAFEKRVEEPLELPPTAVSVGSLAFRGMGPLSGLLASCDAPKAAASVYKRLCSGIPASRLAKAEGLYGMVAKCAGMVGMALLGVDDAEMRERALQEVAFFLNILPKFERAKSGWTVLAVPTIAAIGVLGQLEERKDVLMPMFDEMIALGEAADHNWQCFFMGHRLKARINGSADGLDKIYAAAVERDYVCDALTVACEVVELLDADADADAKSTAKKNLEDARAKIPEKLLEEMEERASKASEKAAGW